MHRKINFAYLDVLLYAGEIDKIPVAFEPFFWSSPEREKLFYPHLPYAQFASKEEIGQEYGITLPMDSQKLMKINPDLHNNIFNQTIQYPLINTKVEHNTIQHFLDKGEKMIVPVMLDEEKTFTIQHNNLYINEDILNNIHNGNITLLFSMHHEGHFHQMKYIEWMNGVGEFFNLDKSNLFLLNSNLISDELCKDYENVVKKENKFTVITDPYFEHRPWFIKNEVNNIYSKDHRVYHYTKFFEFIENNKQFKKTNKILSFNRRLDVHRIITYSQLKTNPTVKDDSIVSLGAAYFDNTNLESYYTQMVNYHKLHLLNNNYRILKNVKSILPQLPIIADENTDTINFANNLNEELHRNTFINVVTESLFNESSVFFSEKIYKPMYCAQPFIIVGNPNSLKKLKEQGYKTFDKWWDESYDEEPDLVKRLNKLEKVYEEIGRKSYEELFQMTVEMEDTLIHNFNTLMSSERLNKLTNFLEDLCKKEDDSVSSIKSKELI